MRAVLDTNAWLDWLVFEDPAMHALRDAILGRRLQPVASARLRAELADVLQREALLAQARAARRRRALPPDPAPALALLARFDAVCLLAPDATSCGLTCSDPDDQYWLDLAVAQRAGWLISKDKALLRLARRAGQRFGLRIVTPQAFHMPDAT
jgi:predicted nucleic acid-binding protein